MAAGVEFLISVGHPPEVVWGYTYRQFRGYTELAWSRVMNQQLMGASSTRAAFHADKEDWMDFVTKIGGDDDG